MDLKTLVKVRGTARVSVTKIISKWKNILEENLEEKDELIIILQNLREKQRDLKQMNREVIMLLDEEELENDAIQCEEIENVLNNRPTCFMYDDDVFEVLTLNSLLYGTKLELKNKCVDEGENVRRKRLPNVFT